jgi:hypothetical protein
MCTNCFISTVVELKTKKECHVISSRRIHWCFVTSNDKQTLVLLLLRAFRGFYGFNSYRIGETRHTAPSLGLFRPEQPNGVSPFLSSLVCAHNVTFLWLGSFRSDHSSPATSAPSLRLARPERLPISLESVRSLQSSKVVLVTISLDTIIQCFQSLSLSLPLLLGAGAPTLPAPALPAVPLCVSEEVNPSAKSIS